MSIANHEDVDTVITGQSTFVLYDGSVELARALPDGRVIIADGASLVRIVRICAEYGKEMARDRDRVAVGMTLIIKDLQAENIRLRAQLTADLGVGE